MPEALKKILEGAKFLSEHGALCLLLGFVFFVLLFRKRFDEMLRRATKVGPGGITANPPEPERQATMPAAATNPLASPPTGAGEGTVSPEMFAETYLARWSNPWIVEVEARVEQDLARLPIAGSTEQTFRVMKRQFAVTLTWLDFQTIYSVLYGTQVQLLRELNVSPLSAEQMGAFYEAVGTANPDVYGQYTAEAWLRYPINQELVLRTEAEGANVTYQITQKGRAFLYWMAYAGKRELYG